MKTHEGWGVMLPCNPPAHYPGESGPWAMLDRGHRRGFWPLSRRGVE